MNLQIVSAALQDKQIASKTRNSFDLDIHIYMRRVQYILSRALFLPDTCLNFALHLASCNL